MFKVDNYYKHENGKDAVIRIHSCKEYDSGYELVVTWHVQSYDRHILPTATSFQLNFISKEHSSEWKEVDNAS